MFARPYRLPHLGPRRTDCSRHTLWFAVLLMASLALTLAACGSASTPTGANATATPTVPKLALAA
jgi:hypothetical protein